MKYSFVVQGEGGLRLDVFLTKREELSLSRSQIKKLAEEGHIFLNGKPVKVSHRVEDGDEIVVEKPAVEPSSLIPENIPLPIIYEDYEILVVDKPAGMVVHPGAGHRSGTLVNALLFHIPNLTGIGGVMRPGIVHRLDKGTSGVMVIAKTERAHRELTNQFKSHAVKKTYQVLVYGDLKREEGIIDLPVGRDISNRKRISTRTRRGREARTIWKVIERFGIATHLMVNTETGRTHQIRAHFTYLGHPLIGDDLYGGKGRWRMLKEGKWKEKIKEMLRPALHAFRLGFFHPVDGKFMEFESPLPEDMIDLCSALRGYPHKEG